MHKTSWEGRNSLAWTNFNSSYTETQLKDAVLLQRTGTGRNDLVWQNNYLRGFLDFSKYTFGVFNPTTLAFDCNIVSSVYAENTTNRYYNYRPITEVNKNTIHVSNQMYNIKSSTINGCYIDIIFNSIDENTECFNLVKELMPLSITFFDISGNIVNGFENLPIYNILGGGYISDKYTTKFINAIRFMFDPPSYSSIQYTFTFLSFTINY